MEHRAVKHATPATGRKPQLRSQYPGRAVRVQVRGGGGGGGGSVVYVSCAVGIGNVLMPCMSSSAPLHSLPRKVDAPAPLANSELLDLRNSKSYRMIHHMCVRGRGSQAHARGWPVIAAVQTGHCALMLCVAVRACVCVSVCICVCTLHMCVFIRRLCTNPCRALSEEDVHGACVVLSADPSLPPSLLPGFLCDAGPSFPPSWLPSFPSTHPLPTLPQVQSNVRGGCARSMCGADPGIRWHARGDQHAGRLVSLCGLSRHHPVCLAKACLLGYSRGCRRAACLKYRSWGTAN